jgi:hypothetical protein
MDERLYAFGVALLQPANLAMSLLLRRRAQERWVLHISAMVHVPWQTTRLLRQEGWHADYLAVGTSPIWDHADFRRVPKSGLLDALDEFWWVWRLIARYRIVHLHFMITATRSGWELYWLRRMGRKIVVHWRGCEIRNRERNMALYPDVNLCQECDYNPRACELEINAKRRRLARRFGDAFLVTTPDLLEFEPKAQQLPFFAPDVSPPPGRVREANEPFRLVHVTVHQGLEATGVIRRTVERLRTRGYQIEFVALSWIRPEEVLRAFAGADMAIGKMRMGYYANAQIESMAMGVPTITFVRPQFMTDELRASGFIFSSLNNLESTLAYYMDHPEALAAKRATARRSILRLHDNRQVAAQLARIYDDFS